MRKVLAILICLLITIICGCNSNTTTFSDQSSSVNTENYDVSDITSSSVTDSETSNSTSGKSNAQTASSKESATQSKKSSAQTSSIKNAVSSATEFKDLPVWKKLYIQYATIEKAKYNKYALVYIDNDDIPELYLYGSNTSKVLSAKGNQLIGKDLDGVGGGNYVEKSGCFMNVYAENNCLVMKIYKLDGYFSQTFYGIEDKTTSPPTYYIEDDIWAVTEEEFKDAVAQYIDTSKTTFLHSNALDYDEFVEKVTNW